MSVCFGFGESLCALFGSEEGERVSLLRCSFLFLERSKQQIKFWQN